MRFLLIPLITVVFTSSGLRAGDKVDPKPGPSQAADTPYQQYRRKISEAVGGRWNEYVNSRTDLTSTGSVRIKFYIARDGHVEDVKILSNDADAALAKYSMQSIMTAVIPPPPPEVASSLKNGRFEVTYTFTVYPQ